MSGLGEGRLAGTISVASKETEEHTARAIAGRTVRGSDGKRLGNIKDILIDPYSGEVPYAVIASGGIFARDRLCLVPFKALKPDASHSNDYTVLLNEDQWDQLSLLAERDFESGRITITDSERHEIAHRFGAATAGTAASGSDFYTQGINSYLVRAEELRGREVYLGGNRVGSIKDVVMDPKYGTAFALFDPSSRFSNAGQKFVVPLNRYSFGDTKRDRVTTILERADFDRMRDIVDPSKAVGPNATAANAGAPRQGVAVQEAGDAKVANAKAAAMATGSFGTPNPSAPAIQGGGSIAPAFSPPPNGAQPPAASGNPKAGQVAAANSGNEPANQKAGNGAQAAHQAPKPDSADAQAKASQPPNSPANQKAGQGMASGSKPMPQKPEAQKSEPSLEPTGRTNAEPNAPGGESLAAARSIRQMLDQESAEIARVEVSVDPASGALVLKGSVADAQLKKAIEDRAAQAAKGAKIDSRIEVEKK